MQIEKIIEHGVEIAHVVADDKVINDLPSAIDLMMTVKYNTGTKNIAIAKDSIIDKFFILSNGLAGEILQKFINYQFRIAIYGDYSKYISKPLKDFIYESNKGTNVFFVESLGIAIEKLANTK